MRIANFIVLTCLVGCRAATTMPDDASLAADQFATPDVTPDAELRQDAVAPRDQSAADTPDEVELDTPVVSDGGLEDSSDVLNVGADVALEWPDDSPVNEAGAVDVVVDIPEDNADSSAEILCPVGDGGMVLTNLNWDWTNCGGCGRRCCGGFCSGGRCTAEGPPGTGACPLTEEEERRRGCFGPIRVRPAKDPENCGGCGHRCQEGQVCERGSCISR